MKQEICTGEAISLDDTSYSWRVISVRPIFILVCLVISEIGDRISQVNYLGI